MLSSGATNDRLPGSPGSAAFARKTGRRIRWKRWAVALPLIVVSAITFNGPAPAEPRLIPDEVAFAVSQVEPRWSVANAQALLAVIGEAQTEGLDPADYHADALGAAVALGRPGPELDALANAAALRLAHDYADGRIDDKKAFDWHFQPPTDPNRLASALGAALDAGQVDSWLRGLLPDNEQYRALKAAYASTPPSEIAVRDQLRANLERWRWMPRALGDRYIYVNVPAYRLELINGGIAEASYNVVVGAPKTPTPQLLLQAQSVVANPSWTLPPSVLKEGGWQRKGYKVSRRSDGSLMVRQAPGPLNALGRIKIDMPNSHAIYLHDTPNKTVFDRDDRALSHGCIRVQNIEELAALLQSGVGLDEALADPSITRVLQLEKSVPVYIVYFTARAEPDGTVTLLDDPYQRDQAMLDHLGGAIGGAVRMAAR